MSVFDLLTDRDKELIQEYIENFAPMSGSIVVEDLRKALGEWDKQKSKDLITLFGDKDLILRRPFSYQITKDNLQIEIRKEIDKHPTAYQNMFNFLHRLQYRYDNDERYPVRFFTSLMNMEHIISGCWEYPRATIVFEDGEVFKISTGMRIMKIIYKVFQKFNGDEDIYEAYRIWHSQLFNQTNIDGELCLSIHPLDFMTMSDNANGWNSCMRWTDDSGDPGDYREGTVECMNSPYILIAYLHNHNRKFTPKDIGYGNLSEDWEWNSKRWRELFIVQQGFISEIKGYPYQDEHLTNSVLMWIKELAHNNLGWDYDDEEVNIGAENEQFNEEGYKKIVYINPEPTYYMYKDFGSLDLHRGRVNMYALYDDARGKRKFGYSLNEYYENDMWHYFYDVPYGGVATCVCCGGPVGEYESRSDAVLCQNCDSGTKCACCGQWISNGYFVYDIPEFYDEPVCENCLEWECAVDDVSGITHYNGDNMMLVYLADRDGTIHDDLYFTTYDPSYPNENPEYYSVMYNAPHAFHENWTTKYYVTFDDIKDTDYFFNHVVNLDDEDYAAITAEVVD